MIFFWYLIIVGLSFCGMEGVAWLSHKYLMHGPLWQLHEDHHQRRDDGFFEKNDAFFLIFALPCIALLWAGVAGPVPWMIACGIGIFLYGAAYFLVHDVIIHQRFKWFSQTDNQYVRAIRWAHKMHHKHLDRHHGESFGMLYVARKYREKVRRDRALQRKGAVS